MEGPEFTPDEIELLQYLVSLHVMRVSLKVLKHSRRGRRSRARNLKVEQLQRELAVASRLRGTLES